MDLPNRPVCMRTCCPFLSLSLSVSGARRGSRSFKHRGCHFPSTPQPTREPHPRWLTLGWGGGAGAAAFLGWLLTLPPARPRGHPCLGPTSSASWALVRRVCSGWGTAGSEALQTVGTWQLPPERKGFSAVEPPGDKLPRVDPRMSSRIPPVGRTSTHPKSAPPQAALGLLGESKPVSSQSVGTGSLALTSPQSWTPGGSHAVGQAPRACQGHLRATEWHAHPSDTQGRIMTPVTCLITRI